MAQTIYDGMDKDDRNRIIKERCRHYGTTPTYDEDGNAGYVPDQEDVVLYYENCEDPELKESIGNALTSAMGDPYGTDDWQDIW